MNKFTIAGVGIGIAVAAALYFFVLPMLSGKPTPAPDAASAVTPAPEVGLMYPMTERVLNLAPADGTPHYARIQLTVEFKRPKGAAKPSAAAAAPKGSAAPLDPALQPVDDRRAQIDDALVRILGAKTVANLTSGEGKDSMKKELLAAVAQIVPRPEASAVYIVQLIVQ